MSAQSKVWKRITLGTGIKDADGFLNTIKDGGMRISQWVKAILGKPAFSVATEKTDVSLVVVSVAELGFKYGATLKDICVAAKKHSLELCPNEVGPQLRLQYKDQPKDEWLLIGMEPITGSSGIIHVFSVVHDDCIPWLRTSYGVSGRVWSQDCRFVFVLPRK